MFSHFGEPMNGWTLMLRIAVAVFVGAIIGAEREMKNRPAGMRTHVLVFRGFRCRLSGRGYNRAFRTAYLRLDDSGVALVYGVHRSGCRSRIFGSGCHFGIGRSGCAEADAESRADYDLQTFGSAVYQSDVNAGVSQ